MIGTRFRRSCCTTTRGAMWLWLATFAGVYGPGLILREALPAFRPYGDTMILTALAAACVVNFCRNRTLHCGITAPVFMAAAFVALLGEAGVWNVEEPLLWIVVLACVMLAFCAEWRMARAASHG